METVDTKKSFSKLNQLTDNNDNKKLIKIKNTLFRQLKLNGNFYADLIKIKSDKDELLYLDKLSLTDKILGKLGLINVKSNSLDKVVKVSVTELGEKFFKYFSNKKRCLKKYKANLIRKWIGYVLTISMICFVLLLFFIVSVGCFQIINNLALKIKALILFEATLLPCASYIFYNYNSNNDNMSIQFKPLLKFFKNELLNDKYKDIIKTLKANQNKIAHS